MVTTLQRNHGHNITWRQNTLAQSYTTFLRHGPHTIQIVTDVEDIIEIFLSEIRKILPRDSRQMATFYQLRARKF